MLNCKKDTVAVGGCQEVGLGSIEFSIEQVVGTTQGQFKGVFPSPDKPGEMATVTEAMSVHTDGRGGYVAAFLENSFFSMVLGLRAIQLPAAGEFTFTNQHNRTYSWRSYSLGS